MLQLRWAEPSCWQTTNRDHHKAGHKLCLATSQVQFYKNRAQQTQVLMNSLRSIKQTHFPIRMRSGQNHRVGKESKKTSSPFFYHKIHCLTGSGSAVNSLLQLVSINLYLESVPLAFQTNKQTSNTLSSPFLFFLPLSPFFLQGSEVPNDGILLHTEGLKVYI